ncbi:hypothetical protein BV22DRAFT_1048327 [Leucogyrophana mollusca]|uniref:Uncharacterized protein n=1 Tax=Leucogyrophana mollusca TaxID=85980 RepID=A0ACB8BCP9_9AGAM|nr:hypothetical protein BV22DRAFT_1048327 [Leucogyrophana mollusca]
MAARDMTLKDSREAEKTAKEARKEAEDAAKNTMEKNSPTAMVPKPKAADFNEGTDRLRKVMCLMDDQAEYLAIQGTIHDLVPCVGLDFAVKYTDQPSSEFKKLFKLAHRAHPLLGHFQNDWATAELIKQYLCNHHKSIAKK